jgi:N-acetylmuramoyl-L-alanine amidase
MRELNRIIMHSTATQEGKDYDIQDIRKWHLQRGFADVGYHFVIYRNGIIAKGRNIEIQGAHTLGHNKDSVGVAYIGGIDANGKAKDTRTLAQKVSMRALILYLRLRYRIKKVMGHKECTHTECPSFDSEKYAKNVKHDPIITVLGLLYVIYKLYGRAKN